MSLSLLILRPLDGALQTERRAKDLGLATVVDPLFVVESMQWSGPEATDFDALLLTSANAVKYGGTQLAAYRYLPVLAVGEKTAEAAKKAGFHVEITGQSDVEHLLDQLADSSYRNIIWLAGEQHMEVSAKDRKIYIAPVYRARAMALGERAKACLANESVILLHSARAASQLAEELSRLQLPKDRHHVVAFSAKVAEAVGQGWKSVQTADHPDDEALLSLASALCR
ncbi:uroporphyrinogen-III synthase [Parasphingorhabdus sp.]|uniref:uroporphyrinogen-III synthase n=1 Tax=Parasphingorhabdus sp. TaxID=2709688 RepID=UPI003A95B24B